VTGAGTGDEADVYDKQLQQLDDFDTIQDFWSCFHALPSPDTVQYKHCFHMMKTGVKPEWEDTENVNGGTWTFKVEKQNSYDVWQSLLLSVIGETFTCALPSSDEICGVTVKGGSTNGAQLFIQIWHKDSRYRNEVIEQLKQTVGRRADLSTSYYTFNHTKAQQFHKSATTPQRTPGKSPGGLRRLDDDTPTTPSSDYGPLSPGGNGNLIASVGSEEKLSQRAFFQS